MHNCSKGVYEEAQPSYCKSYGSKMFLKTNFKTQLLPDQIFNWFDKNMY